MMDTGLRKSRSLWKKNQKTVIASGVALVIFLVLFFVPLATVPVQATETCYTTEMQFQPVTETIISREAYFEPVIQEDILFRDYLIPVQWGMYVDIPLSLNLSDKANPMLHGNFVSLDQMGVRFLILDTYNFMLFQKPFTPAPVYESRNNAGSFSFVPEYTQYYFVFDNLGYNFLRYFKLNVVFSWTQNITKYREVPVTQIVYKQIPVQVERQREVIKYERRSLFQLLTG